MAGHTGGGQPRGRPDRSSERPARGAARRPRRGADPGRDRPGPPRGALRGLDRAVARAGAGVRSSAQHRGGRLGPGGRPSGAGRGPGAGRQHGTGGRFGARPSLPADADDGPGPTRSGGPRRADRGGRCRGHGRSLEPMPVRLGCTSGRPGVAGLGDGRGDGCDECRRDRGLRLRDDARAGPGARGRPRRRARRALGGPSAQGQLRLRPDRPARRQRGHARGDHRGGGGAAPTTGASTVGLLAVPDLASAVDLARRVQRGGPSCSPRRWSTRRPSHGQPTPSVRPTRFAARGPRNGCSCSKSPTAGRPRGWLTWPTTSWQSPRPRPIASGCGPCVRCRPSSIPGIPGSGSSTSASDWRTSTRRWLPSGRRWRGVGGASGRVPSHERAKYLGQQVAEGATEPSEHRGPGAAPEDLADVMSGAVRALTLPRSPSSATSSTGTCMCSSWGRRRRPSGGRSRRSSPSVGASAPSMGSAG